MRHGIVGCALVLVAGLLLDGDLSAGSLEPPGPPAPTMKTLAQVESRTPITSLPFTINQPGSYYLTGNLTGVAGQVGITITADWVTLDLNGFSLIGVASSLDGIRTPFFQRQLVIRNGVIRDWGGAGISASNSTVVHVEGLRVDLNAGTGLLLGSGSLVRGTTAYANGVTGISVGVGSTILESAAGSNSSGGFILGSGGQISHSVAQANFVGILSGDGASIEACNVEANTDDGIRTGTRGLVRGTVAHNNFGDGIQVTGNENRIEDNQLTQNSTGIRVTGTNNLVVRNSAGGNSTEYSIGPGNKAAPVSADPTTAGLWANFDL